MNECMNYVKKRAAEYLKPLGLMPNSTKRLWAEDNGFYLTYVDIAPWHDFGVCFDVAVQFLWRELNINYFEYSEPDPRIIISETQDLGGCISFDEFGWQEQLDKSLEAVCQKVVIYRALRDIRCVCESLKVRHDLLSTHYDYQKRDTTRATALALTGNIDEAKEIFNYSVLISTPEYRDDFSEECLKHIENGDFTESINLAINRQRQQFSKKWKPLKANEFPGFK